MQTFKVGDWITSYSEVQQVDKVSKDGKTLFFNSYKPVAYTDYWSSSKCSHWQPQPGELVILKDKNGIISVIKYNGEPNVYPFIGEITWLHKKD